MKYFLLLFIVLLFSFFAIKRNSTDLIVPNGFEVSVVIDSIPGGARHIAVRENGDIYVKLKTPGFGANIALRDTNNDGRADIIKSFGNYKERGYYGTAMRIHNGYLYFSTELEVFRSKLIAGQLLPDEKVELIVRENDLDHGTKEHSGKPIAFDDQGHIYVPFGAPSNACQVDNRMPNSPGIDPCPLLENNAGVWQFDANKLNQKQKDGLKYASGIRSLVGMEWNPFDQKLYAVMHGIDDLHRIWPKKYTEYQSTLLPSDEFLKLEQGSNSGWPYCYYDYMQQKKLLSPEYGGDGKKIGSCENLNMPIVGFPGHWAPNDMYFYNGEQFPDRYKKGVFVSFHGSTIRAPYPQAGYFIGFIPYENGAFSKKVEAFADGFAQIDPIINVSDAAYRPMGIAMGPDGSMYFADTEKGKIWRVKYTSHKNTFNETNLRNMVQLEKTASNIRTPDIIKDNIENQSKSRLIGGEKLYITYCGNCHQKNGLGATGRFPTLVSDWVVGDKPKLINAVLKGLEGDIKINNKIFSGAMPRHDFLKDYEIAYILTYIRKSFGNKAEEVTIRDVAIERDKLPMKDRNNDKY